MSATINYRRPAFEFTFSGSPGTSSEAGIVQGHLDELAKDFRRAETLHGQAVRELEDTFLDSRQANWDGYEALPVSDAAFLRGQDFLNQLLPRFPAPTTSATPGGALALEWFVSPKRRFLVSLAEDSRIAFAGLFGLDVVHGTGVFSGDVPSEIIQHLKRLFFV